MSSSFERSRRAVEDILKSVNGCRWADMSKGIPDAVVVLVDDAVISKRRRGSLGESCGRTSGSR